MTDRTLRCGARAPADLAWYGAPVKLARLAPALACAAVLRCSAPEPTPEATPAPPVQRATAPHHGYGPAIAWRGFDVGFKDAAALGRPVMLLVHAAWCSRCKALRPIFSDPALVELSREFVMINVDQDLEPQVLRHGPDGTYIPRVLFFSPAGELYTDVLNPTRQRYKYFYMPTDDLVGAMRRALAHGPI